LPNEEGYDPNEEIGEATSFKGAAEKDLGSF
jgi:hypothetical protein